MLVASAGRGRGYLGRAGLASLPFNLCIGPTLGTPMLDVTLCCHRLELLNHFLTRGPTSSFCIPANLAVLRII